MAVDPTPVNRVHITHAGCKKRLCTRGSEGKFIRVSESGEAELAEACPEYLAEDSLWRYMKNEGSLSIIGIDSIGGVGNRQLEKGRFTDDTVAGLPVTGGGGEGIFHLGTGTK